jgi:hypothetical protein
VLGAAAETTNVAHALHFSLLVHLLVHPVHALNKAGEMFTILVSAAFRDETTRLAFYPDGRHLYFAFQ